MVNSLYNAASGMNAQQINMDIISNNFANVNTTAFKKEVPGFKTLLYQTLQEKSTTATGEAKPIGVQVGLGVKNAWVNTLFTQGSMQETGISTNFGIDGKGFFMAQQADGTIAYTRDGSLNWAIGNQGITLATAEGDPILNTKGQPIVVENTYDTSKINVDESGNLSYTDANGKIISLDQQIGLVQFSNPAGLEKISNNLYQESAASGVARLEVGDAGLKKSKLRQNYLEGSNVDVASEIVNLIVAQRAYEMNSKVISASDEMLQQANNLRR